MTNIELKQDNDKRVDVSVRSVSQEHWKALKKMAALEEKNLARFIEQMVEERLEASN